MQEKFVWKIPRNVFLLNIFFFSEIIWNILYDSIDHWKRYCSKCPTPINPVRFVSIQVQLNPSCWSTWGIRTNQINNTLLSMSIRTQLYLYQYSLLNPIRYDWGGIRTSQFNNTLVSISIWTWLYLYQSLTINFNPDTIYINSQSLSNFKESDSGRFPLANQEVITLAL